MGRWARKCQNKSYLSLTICTLIICSRQRVKTTCYFFFRLILLFYPPPLFFSSFFFVFLILFGYTPSSTGRPSALLLLYVSIRSIYENRPKNRKKWLFFNYYPGSCTFAKEFCIWLHKKKYSVVNTVAPRNTGSQGTKKFHLLLADFRYCQYRKLKEMAWRDQGLAFVIGGFPLLSGPV